MSAEFFAAILEGFEGTLDEVLVRSRSLQPGRLTPAQIN